MIAQTKEVHIRLFVLYSLVLDANPLENIKNTRRISKIKSPIIYILGGRSTIVPAETQDEPKKALPQAQIVSIPGVGHYPSEENTEAYLAIVDRILASQ